MKQLRNRFERFCFRNRGKGIPNLMLYIAIGSAIVYLMSMIDRSNTLYYALCFSRSAILHGQIWRLFTYPLTYDAGNLLLTAVGLLCYYMIGRSMEAVWGTFKFNLFYLSGILMMDVYCIIFGCQASVSYLNTSLFLSYATMFPDAQFLLFFIIPVRAWIFALIELAFVVIGFVTSPFPYNLFSIISLANYFLFFGKDVLNVIPLSWRMNASRLFRGKKAPQQPKVVPFTVGNTSQAQKAKAPYTHRCTVCGRTDVSNPELEFRYCSRCAGYRCYCSEHINNHAHIQ